MMKGRMQVEGIQGVEEGSGKTGEVLVGILLDATDWGSKSAWNCFLGFLAFSEGGVFIIVTVCIGYYYYYYCMLMMYDIISRGTVDCNLDEFRTTLQD
jgi:hypothetical protein